ncbi:MAG: hypothetical protein KGO81_01170 [Bacteroidota bacterium]|nr:hypothetical protein [Bacteroidota bacterium]
MMNSVGLKYTEEKKLLLKKYDTELNIYANDFLHGKFNLVSANLHNYLPSIPFEDHNKIFKDLLLHQELSQVDQNFEESLYDAEFENLTDQTWSLLRNGGTIICTFHTGSYRLINQFLIKNQVQFSLVIASNVLQAEGNSFQRLYNKYSPSSRESEFQLIDAEESTAGLKMLRELKSGRSLVIYIDGNNGSGKDESVNNNLISIQFLENYIRARKGIAYIAYLAKAPILPIICERIELEKSRLTFLDVITPQQFQDREEFVISATQKMYSILGEVVKKVPAQWEGWLYLHKFAVPTPPSERSAEFVKEISSSGDYFILNAIEYGVFTLLNKYFLFMKRTYESFMIPAELYELLFRSIISPLQINLLDEELKNDLIYKGVILIK